MPQWCVQGNRGAEECPLEPTLFTANELLETSSSKLSLIFIYTY